MSPSSASDAEVVVVRAPRSGGGPTGLARAGGLGFLSGLTIGAGLVLLVALRAEPGAWIGALWFLVVVPVAGAVLGLVAGGFAWALARVQNTPLRASLVALCTLAVAALPSVLIGWRPALAPSGAAELVWAAYLGASSALRWPRWTRARPVPTLAPEEVA